MFQKIKFPRGRDHFGFFNDSRLYFFTVATFYSDFEITFITYAS